MSNLKKDNIAEYVFRPIVDKIDELNSLSNQLNSSPTKLVNLFVNIGCEVLRRTLKEIELDFQKKINDKIYDL